MVRPALGKHPSIFQRESVICRQALNVLNDDRDQALNISEKVEGRDLPEGVGNGDALNFWNDRGGRN